MHPWRWGKWVPLLAVVLTGCAGKRESDGTKLLNASLERLSTTARADVAHVLPDGTTDKFWCPGAEAAHIIRLSLWKTFPSPPEDLARKLSNVVWTDHVQLKYSGPDGQRNDMHIRLILTNGRTRNVVGYYGILEMEGRILGDLAFADSVVYLAYRNRFLRVAELLRTCDRIEFGGHAVPADKVTGLARALIPHARSSYVGTCDGYGLTWLASFHGPKGTLKVAFIPSCWHTTNQGVLDRLAVHDVPTEYYRSMAELKAPRDQRAPGTRGSASD